MNGKTLLNQTDVANPCGLIAKSLFNDTYTMYTTTSSSGSFAPSTQVNIDSTNIAWKSDVEYKFKNLDVSNYADI